VIVRSSACQAGPVPGPFLFDRRFDLDTTPAELWAVLSRTDQYPIWWSWLRTLEGGDLRAGAVAHCVVRAPLPYTLRFDVAVEDVVPHQLVSTKVSGDLEGPARLEIEPRPIGCAARLAWTLNLRDTLLGPLSAVARPAMAWAHNWVVEVGFRQFERRALDGYGSTP
jgi:uncharacterized protein YndB with AHSA1/START domain